MGFSVSTEWDVRTTGSDGNGGGFNVASSGTDYSQQNSPQITYTDLAIDGTTNTKCTSSGNPFTSAHVGNIINITSGSGFTVQRVQIVSVTTGVATCDKSLGTLSSTGGHGVLGGALATPGAAVSLLVAGNTIHIKSGTYTLTSTLSLPDASTTTTIIGYGSTHRDFGNKPLLTTATNGVVLIQTHQGNSTPQLAYNFSNISLSNTASSRSDGLDAGNGNSPSFIYRCTFDGFTTAVNAPGGAAFDPLLVIDECEVMNCTSYGIRNRAGGRGDLHINNCYIHNNGSHGIRQEGGTEIVVINSLITANGGDGFNQSVNDVSGIVYIFERNTFAGNSGDDIRISGSGGGVTGAAYVALKNNILYSSGPYGIDCPVAPRMALATRNNAFGAHSSGARLNFPVGPSDVTLTADPFVDSASGNYYLNNAMGGGALLRGTGYQWGA